MVQVRAHQPVNDDGSINLEAWLEHVTRVDPALDRQALHAACEFAREAAYALSNAPPAAGFGPGSGAGLGLAPGGSDVKTLWSMQKVE